MSGAWPKVIRDPVHNIIPFEDTPCDRLLLKLINTKEFQRLRRIKQLGVSQFVFPGADHSRFAHSIGVMHTARKFLDRLARTSSVPISEELRTIVLAASLIHDVGHGPFSHAFEKVTGESHEERTLEIVNEESTEVHQVLTGHAKELPAQVMSFFGEGLHRSPGAAVPAFLTKVVSGQLDADRFDYLLRDSYATGSRQGQFDVDWLLQHLLADADRGRLLLHEKALFAAEAYVFARYHMYRTVYFHKTTRAAEVMLRLLFQRYKELLSAVRRPATRQRIAPGAPAAIVGAFSAGDDTRLALGNFLSLDDHSVTEFLKSCGMANDRLLRDLGNGLLHRRLYKATDASRASIETIGPFEAVARERLASLGLDQRYGLVQDAPSDTPYKPYEPDAFKQTKKGEVASDTPEAYQTEQIYVETAQGVKELSACSEPVDQLTKRYSLLRYYYPQEIRGEIEEIARVTLRKETSQ